MRLSPVPLVFGPTVKRSPFAGVPFSVRFHPFCEIVAPAAYAFADEIVVFVDVSTRS